MNSTSEISVRALQCRQGSVPLYSFFLPGSEVTRVADVSRVARSEGNFVGFQREPIRKHIASIVDYLRGDEVLFPNAILLALLPNVRFARSRGPAIPGLVAGGHSGVLTMPTSADGSKCAWIVDGQQRSLALSQAGKPDLLVPVVAFMSSDIQQHREQFILVNKARPLPRRLVDELLPEVAPHLLPPDLAVRQIPSALVNRLDADPASPFFGLIRRTTSEKSPERVVTDSALVKVLQQQIHQPLGALACYRSVDGASTDPEAMFQSVVTFWGAVRAAFPNDWGLPPERSRLLHGAGIQALGALMDFLMPRARQHVDPGTFLRQALQAIAPACAWRTGSWPDMDCAWNDIENTPRAVRRLADQLVRLASAGPLRHAA